MALVPNVKQTRDDGRSLSREDCVCPICLEIYMEPVTLPCTHTFCKVCFLESVAKATLCCPLCRKRVSTWARQHSRDKSLVNETLWKNIQRMFPLSSEMRQGHEAEEPLCFPRLSEPGALRQEYEDQVSKLTEEKRVLEEQERRASEELIQRLLAEEEELLKEQRRRHEDDERMAQLLSRELNAAAESSQSRGADETPVKKKPVGQIDRFLCPLPRSPAHSSLANKENMLAPRSSEPPQLDFYGPETDQSLPEESRDQETDRPMDQSDHRDGPEEGRAKRKSSEARSEEEEESQGKRSCQSSSLVGVAMAEWEEELQRRRRQEEEDLRLALALQKELNKQQQETDRRKGSQDAYFLRAERSKPTCRRHPAVNQTPAAKRPPASTATKTQTLVQRKRPPTATATLSSLSSLSPLTTSDPQTAPKPSCPITSPLSTPKPRPETPKTCHNSPQTTKSKRQTTLTDLFNLHS